jgi:hypothetical protein
MVGAMVESEVQEASNSIQWSHVGGSSQSAAKTAADSPAKYLE